MRKLKVFISICLLSASLPTSVFASYILDQDKDGVDIQDVVRAITNEQGASAITGKSTFEKADIQNLLSQIQPVNMQAHKGTVTGFIKDDAGNAVIDAEVTLDGTTMATRTDAYGQFVLTDVPVIYQTRIDVTREGYTAVSSEVFTVLTGDTRNLGNLIMGRKSETESSLTGVVRDNTTNPSELANVEVTLQANDGSYVQTVTSNANGAFSFSHIPTNSIYILTITKAGYLLYPISPFTLNSGQNTKDLSLQQGAAVSTESELLAALADPNLPYILLLNTIHLTSPYIFNRDVQLAGVYMPGSTIQLIGPGFGISTPHVSWGGLEIYSDVGNDEKMLQAALSSFLDKMKVNNLAGYTGFITRVSQKNYFLSDDVDNLTAFVSNAEGLGNALANEMVSNIYVAANIYSYGNLDFHNRSIHLTSQTAKTIQNDGYSNADKVQLTNVTLLPDPVITPDPGVPVTSIGLSLYTNSNRISSNSYSAVRLLIEPETATNKNIVWSIDANGIATVTQQGHLSVSGLGHITLTATDPLSGISQTLELEAVDSESALRNVQAYATSGGTTTLTLEDLKNTCLGNIMDSAFDNYKRALVAKGEEFVGLESYAISNLLQDIISNYTSTAPLNEALYAYIDGQPADWNKLNRTSLAAYGVYQTDDTNVQYVKQVILDTFVMQGGPLGSTQLNNLVSKVPSFSIRGYNPTVYATQMISQHLNGEGSNVVVTFKVANLYGNGNTELVAGDVKAKISGTLRGLNDSAMFANFTNLGEGLYSFEVQQSALEIPLMIEALTIRVNTSDIPIATNISVNRQAALIENSAANHTMDILDELLFTTGHLPSLIGINFITLKNNLELAYTAHGNELTEGTIARIINGMHVVASSHITSGDMDTYHLLFDQNVTGSLYYSVSARNQSGFLSRNGTSSSGNIYDFSFGHTSMFPVALTYMADTTETLRYTSDGSVVPDFEIIFTDASM